MSGHKQFWTQSELYFKQIYSYFSVDVVLTRDWELWWGTPKIISDSTICHKILFFSHRWWHRKYQFQKRFSLMEKFFFLFLLSKIQDDLRCYPEDLYLLPALPCLVRYIYESPRHEDLDLWAFWQCKRYGYIWQNLCYCSKILLKIIRYNRWLLDYQMIIVQGAFTISPIHDRPLQIGERI